MKIEEQVLSIEQMKHLKELGVEVKDTALGWGWFHGLVNKQIKPVLLTEETKKTFESVGVVIYPTLTLQEILEMLPKEVKFKGERYFLRMLSSRRFLYTNPFNGCAFDAIRENVLEAAFKMLCWVAENGYLKITDGDEKKA